MATPAFITVVSGLPRSGTSLAMQMLKAGGLHVLDDNARAPDENNPRGYLEFKRVKQLRSDRSWLPQARGKAVKIIHALLRQLPSDGTFSYRVILMKRPFEEVVASQRVMLEREGKSSADEATLTKVYQGQLAQIEDWLSNQESFLSLTVEYHSVLADPLSAATRIKNFLGADLDLAAMASVVDVGLYRQRQAADAAKND